MAFYAKPASGVAAQFLRYADELKRFLGRRLQNPADVDDCLQEVFVNVWQQSLRGGLKEDLRGYLFTTALNVVRAKKRHEVSRKRDFHSSLSESDLQLHSNEEEADHYWKEGLRLVEHELGNLRPSTRDVFLMHHVEHLTFPEIARRLGVSTRTVEREMARALDHLNAVLGDIFKDIANG